MKSMENDKSCGNDGLTKEFYVIFWDDIKATFVSSIRQAKEKKDRDEKHIKNCGSISLLHVDINLLSKTFSKNLDFKHA